MLSRKILSCHETLGLTFADEDDLNIEYRTDKKLDKTLKTMEAYSVVRREYSLQIRVRSYVRCVDRRL